MSNDEMCNPPWKRTVDTCNPCRDARECLAGRCPSPLKPTNAVNFDTTDAQIVRPYKGLHVPCVPTNRYSSVHPYICGLF